MLEKIILGTYTKKESKGIYEITLDTEKKTLVDSKHLLVEDNPTYLGVANSKVLYTVTKVNGDGGMASYQNNGDGTYSLLNTVTEEGAPPCYVGIDEDRGLVYGANYHKGSASSYKIENDGSLTLADTVQHEGSGPNENQGSAHAHYSDLTPDNRLVVCDLGTDGVYTYDVSAEGKLTEVARFTAAPGTGPRHLVFHPNGQVAYLFGELASTLLVLSYDAATGAFTEVETLSTLPAEHTGFNGGAAIRVSKDGKFVYASNRGHNSIVVFELTNDGKSATAIQHISTEGDFPRDFDLDPTGKFVVVANQNTDNLTLYSRDEASGKLTLIEKDIFSPETVCVYFTK